MIEPSGLPWAAFSDGSDGDTRNDLRARRRLTTTFGVPDDWATLDQVHGNESLRVAEPGLAGLADAMWTTERQLALAVFTADCLGVVMRAEGAVGVAHAGWRGASTGVVARLRSAMTEEGHSPFAAAVGPGIGACCFEVGQDVADRFPGHETTTSWGTTSVDLRAAVLEELDGLDTWVSDVCTSHRDGYFSHRENATEMRMVTLGWLP